MENGDKKKDFNPEEFLNKKITIGKMTDEEFEWAMTEGMDSLHALNFIYDNEKKDIVYCFNKGFYKYLTDEGEINGIKKEIKKLLEGEGKKKISKMFMNKGRGGKTTFYQLHIKFNSDKKAEYYGKYFCELIEIDKQALIDAELRILAKDN